MNIIPFRALRKFQSVCDVANIVEPNFEAIPADSLSPYLLFTLHLARLKAVNMLMMEDHLVAKIKRYKP